jgi:sulfur-oxidizing protein SoxY
MMKRSNQENHPMQGRRQMLAQSLRLAAMLAGAGLLPRIGEAQAGAQSAAGNWNAGAFEAKGVEEALKALGAAAPVASPDVTITAPDIAENGAVVPVGASTALPGVRRLVLMVEKNPATLSAVFDVSDQVEPNLSTRVKMGQSSNVYAVAITKDDKVLFASKEVKVTLGGCGG